MPTSSAAWECVHVCVQPPPVGVTGCSPFHGKVAISTSKHVHSIFQNGVFYLIHVSPQQYRPQIYLLKLTHQLGSCLQLQITVKTAPYTVPKSTSPSWELCSTGLFPLAQESQKPTINRPNLSASLYFWVSLHLRLLVSAVLLSPFSQAQSERGESCKIAISVSQILFLPF